MRILLLCLLLGSPVYAQLPNKPQPTVKVSVHYGQDRHWEKIVLSVPHPTTDKAWVGWNVTTQAVSWADIGMGLSGRAREANPMWKYHPYIELGISSVVQSGTLYLSHKWKREDDAEIASGITPSKIRWYKLNALVIAIHATGIGLSLAR